MFRTPVSRVSPATIMTRTLRKMTEHVRIDMEDELLPTDTKLRELSDSGSFKRAQSYVRSGAVDRFSQGNTNTPA